MAFDSNDVKVEEGQMILLEVGDRHKFAVARQVKDRELIVQPMVQVASVIKRYGTESATADAIRSYMALSQMEPKHWVMERSKITIPRKCVLSVILRGKNLRPDIHWDHKIGFVVGNASTYIGKNVPYMNLDREDQEKKPFKASLIKVKRVGTYFFFYTGNCPAADDYMAFTGSNDLEHIPDGKFEDNIM